MKVFKNPLNNQGAALITALFIMVLVVIVATAMSVTLDINISRTRYWLNATQLYYAAQGVQNWAKTLLYTDASTSTAEQTNIKIDKMPQNFGPQVENGITITGKIEDAQARFNLNNLQNPTNLNQFILLLKAVSPSLSQTQAKTIAEAVTHWVQFQSTVKSASQYTESYAKMHPPYQAAFRPMVSTSELILVSGITPKLYQQLRPYVTALPAFTKINLNTASVDVLMSLGAGLSRQQALAIVALRQSSGGFKNLTQINSNASLKALNIPSNRYTLQSHFFISEAIVKREDQSLKLYTLMNRQLHNKTWQVSTVWQAQGAF